MPDGHSAVTPRLPIDRISIAVVCILAVLAGLALATNWRPSGEAGPPIERSNHPGSSESPGAESGLPAPPDAWSELFLRDLERGPINAADIVAWSGGYYALGYANDYSGISTAWLSTDGRSWMQVDAPFLVADLAEVTTCRGGILAAAGNASGETSGFFSVDGRAWQPVLLPEVALARPNTLAANSHAALAISSGRSGEILYASDCATWQPVAPPAPGMNVQALVSYADGFVALGTTNGDTREAVAWQSVDGREWQDAAIEAHEGDDFVYVRAGAHGLIALSGTPGDPTSITFWTSSDGSRWSVGSNPLRRQWGNFIGDGARLVGYGRVTGDGDIEEWVTSIDGTRWVELKLNGDIKAVLSGQARPFLLRDSLLFSDFHGSWLGVPGPD